MNKQISIQGKQIFYRLSGKGKPVLLLHGFGETGDVWNQQVEFLKNEFLLIVPDLPGSGQSEAVDDMNMEGQAEIIRQIIDAESSELPLTMIGHSMGGYITLAFAKKYPAYLKAFGLFHSTAYADSEEKKSTRKKGIEFINKNGAIAFLQTATPNLFSPFTKDERPQLIDEFIGSLNNFSAPALVSYYEAMMARPDTTNVLKTTPVPVLFVIGEYDNAISFQDSLTLTHLPEKSYIHILHQSGHMGMLEETDKTNTILKAFLSDTNRSRSYP